MGIKDRINTSKDKVLTGKELLKSTINQYGGNVTSSVPTFQELSDEIKVKIGGFNIPKSYNYIVYGNSLVNSYTFQYHEVSLFEDNKTFAMLVGGPDFRSGSDNWKGSLFKGTVLNESIVMTKLSGSNNVGFLKGYLTISTLNSSDTIYLIGRFNGYSYDKEIRVVRFNLNTMTPEPNFVVITESGSKFPVKCYKGNTSTDLYFMSENSLYKVNISSRISTSILKSVEFINSDSDINFYKEGSNFHVTNKSFYYIINELTGTYTLISGIKFYGSKNQKPIVMKIEEDHFLFTNTKTPSIVIRANKYYYQVSSSIVESRYDSNGIVYDTNSGITTTNEIFESTKYEDNTNIDMEYYSSLAVNEVTGFSYNSPLIAFTYTNYKIYDSYYKYYTYTYSYSITYFPSFS